MPDDELESYMQILVDSFSLEWLEKKNNHPIQLLWERNDELSTNELYSLADSIKSLNKIDSDWVKAQVKLAKSRDKNNSRGAIFELLALSMMNAIEHPVQPAKRNQAGYDGVITKPKGQHTRVSIKSYGCSNFQQQFEKKAKEIEKTIIKLLRKYNYLPSQIILDFPDIFPEKREWELLEKDIDTIFKEQRNAAKPFTALAEPIDSNMPLAPGNSRAIFVLIINPFRHNTEVFHPAFNTYTLMISAKFHKNEHLNIYSKLNDACSNLSKYAATETAEIINSLIIHIPDTISLKQCTDWLDQYFDEFPDKPISFVILYQVSVADDITAKTSSINHCANIYTREGKKIEGNYKFCIPVGSVSHISSDMLIVAEFPDGTKETIPIESKYYYQRGEHYIKMLPDGNRGYHGNIKRIGNGVHTNVVIEFPGQKQSAVIKGKFSPSDELLIL
ncbi:hypothetical protein SDC9_77513 [bioreactor metagenome]|uniref:Uncharacterized protein n=1 Tax=bioreactor metagenome TaxID=1076179 RepID=A0A644YR30_9ZZZZ